jgi:hypothetical protein
VPPVSTVSNLAVAVSVLAPAPAAQASQSASESAPPRASTTDPGSETDSDLLLVFALTVHARPDASAPHPFCLYIRATLLVLAAKGGEMRVMRARRS